MTEEQDGKWTRRTLGEICRAGGGSVQTGPFGSQLHAEDYVDDGIPIITVEHLSDGGIAHKNLPLVGDSDYRRLSRYRLKRGDLVFSRVGAIDRCAFVSDAEDGWLFSGRCLRVRTGNGRTDPRYLSYVLNSWPSRQWILNHAVGSTMACLNTSILSSVPLDTAPVSEQIKIAEILSTIDRAIEQTDELIAKQQRIKTGLMQDLLTCGIDEQGNLRSEETHGFKDSPAGRIPKVWKSKPIGAGIEFITDYRGKTPPYVSDGIPVISAESVGGERIKKTTKYVTPDTYRKWTTRGLPEPGDTVFTTEAPVGEIAYLPSDRTYLLTRRVIALRPNEKELTKEFLFWSLRRAKHIGYWDRFTAGTTAPRMKKPDILGFEIGHPAPEEQELICSILESQREAITKARGLLIKLNSLKRSLMQDLLTGNKCVTPLLESAETT